MTILLSGGAKNGKSDLAQELALRLADGGAHYYLATMIPCDGEDNRRIARHRENRAGMGFETVERGRDLCGCLTAENRKGVFLVDSVTALLLNELFQDPTSGELDENAADRCIRDLTAFAGQVRGAVFVSDAIGADADGYDPVTEIYRRSLARVERVLAAVCDTVAELSVGVPVIYKGEMPR